MHVLQFHRVNLVTPEQHYQRHILPKQCAIARVMACFTASKGKWVSLLQRALEQTLLVHGSKRGRAERCNEVPTLISSPSPFCLGDNFLDETWGSILSLILMAQKNIHRANVCNMKRFNWPCIGSILVTALLSVHCQRCIFINVLLCVLPGQLHDGGQYAMHAEMLAAAGPPPTSSPEPGLPPLQQAMEQYGPPGVLPPRSVAAGFSHMQPHPEMAETW